MGWFWGALCSVALHDLATVPGAVVVSHEEVATGGPAVLARLFDVLGLSRTPATDLEYDKQAGPGAATGGRQLHNFDRSPTTVANAWRATLMPGELEAIESATTSVRERLHAARMPLMTSGG